MLYHEFEINAIIKAIETAKLGLWNLNLTSKLLIWNKYMFTLFDKEFCGDHVADYSDFIEKIHIEDRETVHKHITNLSSLGDVNFTDNYRVVFNDNSIRFYQSCTEKYLNADGSESMIGTVFDITTFYNKTESEKEHIILKNQLDIESRHNEEMKTIMRMVAHEIRNPLQGILGSASIIDNMLDSLNDPIIKTIKSCMDDLQECVYHQLNVLNDLIDYNLLNQTSKETLPKSEAVDITIIIQSIIKMFTPSVHNKNLLIRPDICSKINIFTSDILRIKRIIINLVSNSVKFTKEGTVTVKCDVYQNNVRVQVIDTGNGVIDKANIFKTTISHTDSNDLSSGSGLGLMICHKLVTSLHGTIACTDNIPHGTIMTLLIPYVEIKKENYVATTKSNINIQSECTDLLKNKRILFADDNLVNRKVVRKMLERISCHATVLSDGLESLEAARKADFDLLILDVHMVDMDGDEVVEILREEGRFIPVIFLTGEALSTLSEKFQDSVVLLKPCRDSDLYKAMASFFRS